MLSRQILRAIPKNALASSRAAHTDKEFAGLDYYRVKESSFLCLNNFLNFKLNY